MVVTEEEGWFAVHETHMDIGKKAVALAKPQLQVGLAVDVQVTHMFADEPHLCGGIVVEARTLSSSQFAAHRDVVLRVVHRASLFVHQFVGTQPVCAEERNAHLCPFVEALAKSNAEGVTHGKPFGNVVHLLPVSIVQIGVVVFGRAVCQILVLQVAKLEGVYETRDRNELLGYDLLVFPDL